MTTFATLGPGDLYLAAIERDERDAEKWLREAEPQVLIDAGICPKCRGSLCEDCSYTGSVSQCEDCRGAIRPGEEQVVPVCVDQPNGAKVTLCRRCAEAPDGDAP